MIAAQVPVLITWDIDPNTRFDLMQKRQALKSAIELCRELEITATFFFVAQEAASYPEEIAEMIRVGHEIGCHGLTHGDEEEYDRMPRERQRSYIERATHLLEEQTGTSITAFRGPRVKVSPITLRLLAERGYLTDSSVCSQRLDVLSSNLVNTGWLVAPRSPYHPHRDSAFKRGDLDILELPVSALMLPFISTSLYVLKLQVMKVLFRLLYEEARRKAQPIVYLAHPEEFGPQLWPSFKLSDLSFRHLRTHGLMIRKQLNEANPEVRLALNRALLSHISTFPGIRFMTMREYVLQSGKTPVTADSLPTA
jgi:peptidoglycan/xylan/chitin deacetylase (PgdA/CDA1 family)